MGQSPKPSSADPTRWLFKGEPADSTEPPHGIYVRWKPLYQQPIGWEADLNDGVRLNIRPFVQAGVLRGRVNVTWGKDRGSSPDGSERLNGLHLTRSEKQRARASQAPPLGGGGS